MQLVNWGLNLGLVGDADVLELPFAKKMVMEFEALFAIVRVIGRQLHGCVFVWDIHNPYCRLPRSPFKILNYHGCQL